MNQKLFVVFGDSFISDAPEVFHGIYSTLEKARESLQGFNEYDRKHYFRIDEIDLDKGITGGETSYKAL